LDVYVGTVFDPNTQEKEYAGAAINDGLIEIPRANVTMTGKNVRQNGMIDSSTSVSLNGSVILTANYAAASNTSYDPADTAKGAIFNYQSTGTVTFGEDSVTRILPEVNSTEKVIGTALPIASKVTLQGRSIVMQPGAALLAPNATITGKAGVWFYRAPNGGASPPLSQFVYTDGQVYLDKGAFIDAAGTTDAFTPFEQNILTLQFRGAELSNSPLQRDGPLRAVDLVLDIRNKGTFNGIDWVGTPLADATGFVNLIEHTAAQLTIAGGSIDLHAGGSVVMQPGSTVDVSGGWQRYEGGIVQTSRVVSGSQILDIADATPDRVYDGIYDPHFSRTQPKWGITKSYIHPLQLSRSHFEKGYVSGADGGSIAITAPTMALDGKLAGNTTAGTRQIRDSKLKTELPAASRLSLSFESQIVSPMDASIFLATSPHPPKILFANSNEQEAADGFAADEIENPLPLRPDRQDLVVLSPDLVNKDGFGSLTINNTAGRVTIPGSVALNFEPGAPVDSTVASLEITAMNVRINGDITAPGGRLKFTVYDYSPYRLAFASTDDTVVIHTPHVNSNHGNFVLGRGAVLSTAGLIVDDRFTADHPFETPLQLDGGSVAINAFNARLVRGSVIDVSGGAAMSATNKLSFGDAGSISIAAGQDPGIPSLLGGRLTLGSTLKGYAGATGGSLSIQAPLIRIGRADSTLHALAISPDFFNRGGFASFTLTGIGSQPFGHSPFEPGGAAGSLGGMLTPVPPNRALPGLVIEPGTTIAPAVKSWIALPLESRPGDLVLNTTLLDVGLRSPVSLTFNAKSVTDNFAKQLLFRGVLTMGEGAMVSAGPLGKVSLSADNVSVLGSVFAPGGSIAIKGARSFPEVSKLDNVARTTVYIGPGSRLDASGDVVLVPDDFDRRKGTVLPGGSISVSGNIMAAAGAVLDVSGASGMLDFAPAELGLSSAISVVSGVNAPLASRFTIPARVDSDGGSITLAGMEELFVDARLVGRAGGPAALGGELAVSSGKFLVPGTFNTPADVSLIVTQSGWRIPAGFVADGESGVGSVMRDGDKVVSGRGYFAIDRFSEGGFDSLALGGVVQFDGRVDINARQKLSVADGGFIYANDAVRLTAPYVM
ncbi:MAG: hypothetical protein ACREKL_14390, partial [Chthoniobacterales bacterium]